MCMMKQNKQKNIIEENNFQASLHQIKVIGKRY